MNSDTQFAPMLHAIRAWLSPTVQLRDEVRALRQRVAELERAELERETVVNDQLDKLSRMIKRVRSRADREAAASHPELPGLDPVSAAILARRGRLRVPGNGEE